MNAIIIFLMAVLAVSGIASAATVSLDSTSAAVYTGNTFEVNVTIDPQFTSIAGVSMEASFDSAKLEIVSINEGNLLNRNGAKTLFNPGKVNANMVTDIWSVIIENASVTDLNTFATLTFRAIGAGSPEIELTKVNVSEPGGNLQNVIIASPLSIQVISNNTEPVNGGTSAGNGGAGGGGGGGASGENYTNIELREKYDMFIFKDITIPYSFKNSDNPIRFINITGNINAGEIGTAVEVLRDTSTLINMPYEGKVFKNVNIWVGTFGFANPGNIKNAEITFRVPVSWFLDSNIDPWSVSLMHYDHAWYPLTTGKIGEDDTYLYYKAEATGFGGFVITGQESAVKLSKSDFPAASVTISHPKDAQIIYHTTVMGSGEKIRTDFMMLVVITLSASLNSIMIFKLKIKGKYSVNKNHRI